MDNKENEISPEKTDDSVISAMKALQKKKTKGSKSSSDDTSAIPSCRSVDLSTLDITDTSIESQKQDLQNIFSVKPSFQVTCSQSGYMTKMSSLVYNDVFAMTNSNLSNYENKKEIYHTIYQKITGFSAPDWHPSFEEWLKATSFADAETLFYGIYCATFQEKSSVTYDCPICGETNTITIDNSQLVRVNDKEEMMKLTEQISNEAITADKIKEFSLVADKPSNYTTIELQNSKLVFVLKLPTLWDVLELIRTTPDEKLSQKSASAVNLALVTTKFLLPKTDANRKIIPNKYSAVSSKKDVFGILDILSVDDYAALNAAATKMLEDKHITYEIEDQKCGNCGSPISKIPMDIENLLFFQISERQL